MTDQTPEAPEIQDADIQPKKSLFWRLFKWTAITLVFFFAVFTMLARLGGNSDVLKGAIEDFMSDATGLKTQVGTLHRMTFFPNMSIDVQNVLMVKEGSGTLPISIRSAKISMGFFDVMLGKSTLRGAEIMDIRIPEGIFSQKAYSFEYISTIEEEGVGAFLEAKGKINTNPLLARLKLVSKGRPQSPRYLIPDNTSLALSLSDLKLSGDISKKPRGGSDVSNLRLSYKDKKVLEGTMAFKRNETKWLLQADLTLEEGKTRLSPDLELDFTQGLKASGKITSASLELSDFSSGNLFLQSVNSAFDILGGGNEGYAFDDKDIHFDLDIQEIRSGKTKLGSLKTPLTIKDNIVSMDPFDGNLSGGKISGNLALNAKNDPAALSLNVKVKDLDYGDFQRQFSPQAHIDGKADLLVNLVSEGRSSGALQKNVKGEISFIGGEGTMQSDVLNIWGGGLLNALLPNVTGADDLKSNCVVLDFELEQGIAKAKSVFVDTDRVTLIGEGRYDIGNDNFDMQLTPKSKAIAIGDISSSVIVSGSLTDLKANISAFGLGKKIGGMLLGAVNPAFLAVTLADFGLSDNHPCKAYVIEKEELAPLDLPSVETAAPEPETQAQDAIAE